MRFFALFFLYFFPCPAGGGRTRVSRQLYGCLPAAWGQTTIQRENKPSDVLVQKLEYMYACEETQGEEQKKQKSVSRFMSSNLNVYFGISFFFLNCLFILIYSVVLAL